VKKILALGLLVTLVISLGALALEDKFAHDGNLVQEEEITSTETPPSGCPCGEEEIEYLCDGSPSDCEPPGTYDHKRLWCRGTGDERYCMYRAKRCKPC
jgi:hypothetical protein